MIRYEIWTDTFEFRVGSNKSIIPTMSDGDIFETYLSCDTRITSNSLDPHLAAYFPNEESAMAEWNKNYADYGATRLERGNSQYLLVGQIAWLEVSERDENGEFLDGLGTIVQSAEPYINVDYED